MRGAVRMDLFHCSGCPTFPLRTTHLYGNNHDEPRVEYSTECWMRRMV